jgi:hypothetical protein
MYGFGIIAFGIFLLAIGSGIRVFLIFTIIGLSLIALWLYFNEDQRIKTRIDFYLMKRNAYVQSVTMRWLEYVCGINVLAV